MMIRTLLILFLALAGCATDNTYIEAQKAALVRDGDARVAEAQAIAAVASKLDAGGAAAYAVMVATRGAMQQSQVRVERPRDWIDGLNAVSVFVGALGNVAVPIASIKASRDVSIAGFNRDTAISQNQQIGESARIRTVAEIATSVATAPRTPTTQITVTAGGDSLIGSGTIDRRNCSANAGAGAPGGTSLPPATGAIGGAGGNASTGC